MESEENNQFKRNLVNLVLHKNFLASQLSAHEISMKTSKQLDQQMAKFSELVQRDFRNFAALSRTYGSIMVLGLCALTGFATRRSQKKIFRLAMLITFASSSSFIYCTNYKVVELNPSEK
jgi:hypothetical protein